MATKNAFEQERVDLVRCPGVVHRRRKHAPEPVLYERPTADKAALGEEERLLLSRVSAFATVLDAADGSVLLEMPGARPLPALPPGYYFKGGDARETLRRVLQPETSQMFIRDIDLVRFTGVSDRHDHELALRFMDGDYNHGHGVEVAESREVYFRTRDLSVNEVLHRERLFECTYLALDDLLRGRLRPTSYALDAEGNVQGITLMKALRLEAEGLVRGLPLSISGFTERPQAGAFEISLHLDRAFAVNEAVAREYIFSAWSRGVLLPGLPVPPSFEEVLKHLVPQLKRGLGFFRYLSEKMRRGLCLEE